MQPVSVPHGQLVFPVELPFGEYMFFQRMVGLDDQQGCGGFETYSSLDADYGVSYVNVPANTVRSREGIQEGERVSGLVKLFFLNDFSEEKRRVGKKCDS